MPANRSATKILLDGGDPAETQRIKKHLGFLDGQTTNPTFVAKNPDVQRRVASGHRLSRDEQKQEYKTDRPGHFSAGGFGWCLHRGFCRL